MNHEPKLISKKFEEFNCILKQKYEDVNTVYNEQLSKDAFYAGAVALMATLGNMYNSGISNSLSQEIFQNINNELNNFREELKCRHS